MIEFLSPDSSALTASEMGIALMGMNQSERKSAARMQLFPASEGKNAALCFGFEEDFPLSGLNQHGLGFCLCPSPDRAVSYDPGKPDLPGAPTCALLEKCATLTDVVRLVASHNIHGLETSQMLVADRQGQAAVLGVGQDNQVRITPKSGPHQVLTNYNLASPQDGHYPCPRYDIALEMLAKYPAVTIENFRNILSAIHSEIISPTVYSVIYDLAACDIYLFLQHDFGNGIKLNLNDALSSEPNGYTCRLTSLFPTKLRYYAEIQAQELRGEIMDVLSINAKEHKIHERKKEMTKLVDIEGIGEKYAKKLIDAGVASVEALLEKGSTPQGRKEIAEKTGISDKLVLEWVNHADLFRINGVGEEYADLLEEAGVDTVPELAQRKAENLYQKMVEVNKEKSLTRRLPSQAQVSNWIDQAKKMPRVIQY